MFKQSVARPRVCVDGSPPGWHTSMGSCKMELPALEAVSDAFLALVHRMAGARNAQLATAGNSNQIKLVTLHH